MGKVTPELIRAQAKDMRGADIGERRSAEIATDVGRLGAAVASARNQLDFNDEPARFAALLTAAGAVPRKRR